MNREKYLPIGSVVLLTEAKKRVMVTGFVAQSQETGNKVFDYIGCLYPEGIISTEQSLLFNHEQIDQIFYLGYSDEEEKTFKIKLNELNLKNLESSKQGNVLFNTIRNE